MTEAELHAEARRLLARYGLRWHHCARPELCEGTPGLPDLIIAGPRGLLFAEEKSELGRVSPAQRAWLNLAGGARYAGSEVWRGSALPAIEGTLAWLGTAP